MPEGMVRWLTPHIGGAFGSRQSFITEPICVALARKTGKPVRLEDTREEDFVARESRQPFILTGKMGVKKDGTITALQAKLIANAGAYFSHSGATTSVNLRFFMGLYRCHNMDGEADIVYTNTPASGGMRGYGNAQATFAREQLIDIAAEKIGVDPVEFRLRNIKGTGEPSAIPFIPIENSALDECIKLGAERIGWQGKQKIAKQAVIRRGVGMACTTHNSNASPGLLDYSNAFIKLNEDGSANLAVSVCEMGQGALGVLAQIAAEELGLNADDIHIVSGDTDVTQFDPGSHASRSTNVIGNTVLRAAREAKGQLLERAGEALGVSARDLDAKDGHVYVKASPTKRISIAKVARNAIYNYQGDCVNISGNCSFVPQQSPSFQATFAEVEVDAKEGQLKVLKVVIAADIGRAINPLSAEGQFEGAIVQGIGYTLIEDFVIDMGTGIPTTDSFETYKIPTTLDLPEIEVILVERPVASGPFGAKGLGEIALVAVAPAIANAVYDAVGVRVKELPITPEKVLNGLEDKIKSLAI
jgi:xanthine dehydrogenase molybdenum-binding subunit